MGSALRIACAEVSSRPGKEGAARSYESSVMAPAMDIYQRLREDLAPRDLAHLKGEVRAHYDRLVLAQKRDELIAVDLAEMLCVRLEALLAMAHQLGADSRSHVVAAARYFVSPHDAVPDERACTGLDDDVQVFNHMARTVGRPDLVITE